jgi:hypothetical protein
VRGSVPYLKIRLYRPICDCILFAQLTHGPTLSCKSSALTIPDSCLALRTFPANATLVPAHDFSRAERPLDSIDGFKNVELDRKVVSNVPKEPTAGAVMSEFRVYVIGHDGHIVQRIELDQCQNEEEAREAAKRLVDGHDIELWESAHQIERFPHHE